MFEMRFFSPGKSKNRYLGIWYKKISAGTVIWVANRKTPINGTSGIFKVNREGNLVILNGEDTMVWSSNLTVSMTSHRLVAVQLLDNGNLIAWDEYRMKFGKDLVTGFERYMTSQKSPDDPSPVYTSEFVVNQKEIYITYQLRGPVIQRIVLTGDGRTHVLHWIDRIQDWIVYTDAGGDICARFQLCGPYGSCSMYRDPPCSCIEGFEPIFPQEWEASDWSRGCQRKMPLNCESSEFGFTKVSGLKLPDTRKSWYNHSMTLRECDLACRNNCSCMAYANLDSRNGGSGCLMWFDELTDITEFDNDDTIYIKMAATKLAGHESNERKEVLTFVLPILSATLLLSAVARYCIKRNKVLHMKNQGELAYTLDKKNTSMHAEDFDAIQFFSLYKVVKATNNFSDSNKLGEGGFGSVYKGVLENGQEVAVKRMSETSHQGFDEFKNELISIAKLQHRNLVKLLGYCIHENEMILIYEDLKAGNILLDSDWNPKISDFGLARKFVGQDASAKTKNVVGTYGYISPEYAVHGRFSVKSDVFSFGVMVLEIVSGMKNRDFCHEDHRDNLLGHVRIIYETTTPYTPQQNGVAERKNRALKEMINSMLSYSGLSEGFWEEAMLTACYLLNRVPNKGNKTTPYEFWYKKRHNLSFLRVWGCRAVVRLPDPKRKALGEKGIDCIFVGYAKNSKAYRFYVIEPNDSVSINLIIESRDAIFDENCFSSIPRPKDIIPNVQESQLDDHTHDVPSDIPEPQKAAEANLGLQRFFKRKNESSMEQLTFSKHDCFVSSGFALRNQSDKEKYSKFDSSDKCVIICLYVDDMLIFGIDQNQVDKTNKFLSSKFSMKEMGEADVILGIKIKRENKGIVKPVDPGLDIQDLIGCLMYAMTSTRPDIAYTVGRLSRFTSNPSRQRQAITRVFKYLKGTMNYSLSYMEYPSVLEGYSDASWINHVEDSSSRSGWVFLLGGGV
ncbi:G-type lectin S-receptor-like serine/threonine-protein kinase isoform X1 [Tanacetum coccineum]|uniref:G-type lectin S-receptor-like serine/threonine-protein kinase isoform X1 n=1 Tax=Tanacetum coccineum TaxID=301880 RepID=A0ABQ5EJW3_9ASTR